MSNKIINTIAVIDSGIGGLSVLKRLINNNAKGNYIYFADNKNMPYGSKSKKFLLKRLTEIIDLLINKYKVDEIIVACNTASSVLINYNNPKVKIMKFDKKTLYLGTPLLKKTLTKYKVIADKTLAKEIEKNIFNSKQIENLVNRHIKRYNIDKQKEICLGCTHYELVFEYFKKLCPDTIIKCNSDLITDEINLKSEDLNIVILLSNQDTEYEQKIRKIIGLEV